jgi:hypothetical protein
MNKKPARKLQLTRDTLRVLTKDQISNVDGGSDPTASLTIGTSPFPSRGPCSLAV